MGRWSERYVRLGKQTVVDCTAENPAENRTGYFRLTSVTASLTCSVTRLFREYVSIVWIRLNLLRIISGVGLCCYGCVPVGYQTDFFGSLGHAEEHSNLLSGGTEFEFGSCWIPSHVFFSGLGSIWARGPAAEQKQWRQLGTLGSGTRSYRSTVTPSALPVCLLRPADVTHVPGQDCTWQRDYSNPAAVW
jgi:hypothetical protein